MSLSSTGASVSPESPIAVEGSLLLGRDPAAANLVLAHPSVSRRHAQIDRTDRGLSVRDLGTTNGTFINGQKVSGSQPLNHGDQLAIGPFVWTVHGHVLHPAIGVGEVALEASGVHKRVVADGAELELLHRISLRIAPGRMVAVLGPSGCGKSTLLRILSGRDVATEGRVFYEGQDLGENFGALKHSIAFVPQQETLPEDLTVEAALRFTARLRLPADSGKREIDGAVDRAIARVGLQEQRSRPISRLSGGQRKRTALANELLAEPRVLFLDEVTSGLDDATDRSIMELLSEIAGQGMTVVCVTHTVSHVEETCDELIVLAPHGHLAFHGPPKEALPWFGCGSLPGLYDALLARSGSEWTARTDGGATRTLAPAEPSSLPGRGFDPRRALRQLRVLFERSVAVALGDPKALVLALGQAVAVGILFRLAYGAGQPIPSAALQFAFLLGVSSFWFGCSNGSKELVKERALFHLERNINLGIPSYVFSKIAHLALLGSAQVVLMHGALAVSGVQLTHVRTLLPINLGMVVLGSTLGLVISAFSERASQAATVVPLALIPQIVLSGAVVPNLPDLGELLAGFGVSAYWMYRAQQSVFGVPDVDGGRALLALGLHLLVFVGATLFILNSQRR